MIAPGTLETFGLFVARTSAPVLASPILGEGTGLGGHKVALIAIVSGLLYAAVGEPLAPDVSVIAYGVMALRELMIGLVLAMVLQVVILAVRVTGELIGNEMAFSMASMVDPLTGVNTPLVTRIYETMFLIGLLAVDGHHLILRALGDSFDRAPVGEVTFSGSIAGFVQTLFVDMFAAGISFAAPILVLLFLVSALIGLLSRAVPQLNILEVGFTLRIATGLGFMFLFAPLLAPALGDLYEYFALGLDGALEAVGR